MPSARDHVVPFIAVALVVVLADAMSKQVAESLLTGRHIPVEALNNAVSFAVHHNDRSAFGISLGRYTWPVNLAVSIGAVMLMIPVCRELAALDRTAPYALGLICGAALGNLASLVVSPSGVIDFVAIDRGGGTDFVLNLADVAAYVGLLVMMKPTWAIVKALRAERFTPVGEQARASPERMVGRGRATDLELRVPPQIEPASVSPSTIRTEMGSSDVDAAAPPA